MIALGAESLDGGYLLADGVADRGLAGTHRFAVDVNRARAAETRAAPEFCACHLQLFADDPKQRRIVGRFDGHIPSVDSQTGHLRFPFRCMKPLTAASHCSVVAGAHPVSGSRGAKE